MEEPRAKGISLWLMPEGDAHRRLSEIIDRGITAGVLLGAPIGALVAWMNSRQRGIYESVGFGALVTGVVIDPGGHVGLSVSAPWR